MSTPAEYIATEVAAHQAAMTALAAELVDDIGAAGDLLARRLAAGKKILLAGNGGSAADAQHIAAELVGRFVAERQGLPAIALSTDTSALTSIGNDFGFEHVFRRQVEALAREDDVLIVISTSGKSPNLINAAKQARNVGCSVVGWLGKGGGPLAPLCDVAIVVPSNDTQRIQEMHIFIGHVICGLVEQRLASG